MAEQSPKFFSASTLKGLWHYGWFHLVFPFGGEYALCLVLTWIFNAAVLGGALDTPRAALGVLILGVLYRYFHKTSQVKQAPALSLPPITPADLARIRETFGETEAPAGLSPYL